MHQEYLEAISVHFPAVCHDLVLWLSRLLGASVVRDNDATEIVPSNERFLPRISFDAHSRDVFPTADFEFSSYEGTSVYVRNMTDIGKENPSPYNPLEPEEVESRFQREGMNVTGVDHVGFNLPWFNKGVHPAIGDLRNRLKTVCLYHLFPTGESWDFVIPGERSEIKKRKVIDYDRLRKPKFEIVSFEKASTPIIQFDVSLNAGYEKLDAVFPEGISDPKLRNTWVYLRNPSDVDVCLVLNESREGDWSSFFRGHRL